MIYTGNRGMGLEQVINYANQIYGHKNMAVVNKRPTPVKIMKTSGTRILSAYLESASTVDYEGCYQGRSLQFEAKSTKEKTRFPLDNFHQHQIDHMKACINQGAIVFTILEFSKLNETFYVPAKMITQAWDNHSAGGTASITYAEIHEQCEHIMPARGVPLDYLAVIDKLYFPLGKVGTHR
jgi:recombination protein U